MKQLAMMMSVLMGISGLTVAYANEGEAAHENNAPKIEKRIERQKKRISANLEKGKLSQEEAGELNKNVEEAQAAKTAAQADGKITRAERKEIHQKLNKNSRAIRKAHKS